MFRFFLLPVGIGVLGIAPSTCRRILGRIHRPSASRRRQRGRNHPQGSSDGVSHRRRHPCTRQERCRSHTGCAVDEGLADFHGRSTWSAVLAHLHLFGESCGIQGRSILEGLVCQPTPRTHHHRRGGRNRRRRRSKALHRPSHVSALCQNNHILAVVAKCGFGREDLPLSRARLPVFDAGDEIPASRRLAEVEVASHRGSRSGIRNAKLRPNLPESQHVVGSHFKARASLDASGQVLAARKGALHHRHPGGGDCLRTRGQEGRENENEDPHFFLLPSQVFTFGKVVGVCVLDRLTAEGRRLL